MLSRPILMLKRLSQKLGVRVLAGSVLALIAVAVAPLFDTLIPDSWKDRFGAEALLPILNILATSMLTVTTFSLSVMVNAFRGAASQATPRAYRLHLSDSTTQTTLATFTGAFLFSLTALVLFRAEFFSEATSVVIFGLTVLWIAAIILAILRWIDHLSRLGSMDNTLERVQAGAMPPLRNLMERPVLGATAVPAGTTPPDHARALPAPAGGHVQYIDMSRLEECLDKAQAVLLITATPGTHLIEGATLGWISGGNADPEQLAGCFTIGAQRTMEQDARYGLTVMNEIGLRALSPGINDPGTAIEVVRRLTRMLASLSPSRTAVAEFPHVQMVTLDPSDLLQDGFDSLIRAGASQPELVASVLEAMVVLRGSGWPALAEAAARTREYMLAHADAALTVEADRHWLQRKAADSA
ncbi:MAG TPA: DUF2254 domain-containing protein [Citreicella sp.]|jgi:uncharacterized membrane protein|uniref:DUF2254 domain-containing protein n=1 Tax=Salipiger marinus TaxID=555512 RepID=UPI000E855693|nr:DUF2254 domain-containing protein [Citreicella sp.]